MGQREVGGVTCKVTCTWWLLGLAIKAPWLDRDGPILALAVDRLRKHCSHLVGGLFLAGKAVWALGVLTAESTDYCILVNEWVWLRSQVSWLEVDLVQFWSQSLDRNGDTVC